jgi:hypothetical protein
MKTNGLPLLPTRLKGYETPTLTACEKWSENAKVDGTRTGILQSSSENSRRSYHNASQDCLTWPWTIFACPRNSCDAIVNDVVADEGVDDVVSRLADFTVMDVTGVDRMIAGDNTFGFSVTVSNLLEERIRPMASSW